MTDDESKSGELESLGRVGKGEGTVGVGTVCPRIYRHEFSSCLAV